MEDNKLEEPLAELVDQVGEAVQDTAVQIPDLCKRLYDVTSKFNKAKPKSAKGIEMAVAIFR